MHIFRFTVFHQGSISYYFDMNYNQNTYDHFLCQLKKYFFTRMSQIVVGRTGGRVFHDQGRAAGCAALEDQFLSPIVSAKRTQLLLIMGNRHPELNPGLLHITSSMQNYI